MVVFLIYLNPMLMGICLIFAPAYYFLKRYTDNSVKMANAKMLASWGEASDNIHGTLNGIKAIKEAGAEEYCRNRNSSLLNVVAKAFSDLEIQASKTTVVTALYNQLIPFLVMALGLLVYRSKEVSPGEIFAFLYVVMGFFAPFGTIVILGNSVQKGKQSVERVIKYLNLDGNIIESENPIDIDCLKGRIVFDDVSFGYAEKDILHKVSFDIKAGECISIAGPSGAGKTTILALLFRFYDPKAGRVTVDDKNVKDLKLSQYRKQIGYVGQEAILFHSSFLANLMIANEHATIDEIHEACRLSGIHEEIMDSANGYDTIIGEKGMKLSGGQRQRLSLARMILKNPSLIIFDEAFSNLDSESEMAYFENVNGLFKGKTKLIISHRLSSVINSDRIIYLENGRVIDIDSHVNLIKQNPNYRELWKNQVGATVT